MDLIKDNYFMELALAEARKAFAIGEIPIGAVLTIGDEVVASAHNMREAWRDATAHAEMIVIKEACLKLDRWRLSTATIYVTIEPCPMCAGALVMSRIERLVYGSPDYKAGAVESIFNIVDNASLNHRISVRAGVCAEKCSEIMREFFQQKRR